MTPAPFLGVKLLGLGLTPVGVGLEVCVVIVTLLNGVY